MHVIEGARIVEVVCAAHSRVEFNSLTVAQNRRRLAFADKQAHMHTRAWFQFQSELIPAGGNRGRLDHAAGKNQGTRPASVEFGRGPRMVYYGDKYAHGDERYQAARTRKPARMSPE